MKKKLKMDAVGSRVDRKVYFLAGMLIIITVAIIAFKVIHGGSNVYPAKDVSLWKVNIALDMAGKGGSSRIKMYLPNSTDRQIIYNSHFSNGGLDFSMEEKAWTGNLIGTWHANILDGVKQVQYEFSVQTKSRIFSIPANLRLSNNLIASYPPEIAKWLVQSELIQSKDELITEKAKELIGKKKNIYYVSRKLYDFVRDDIVYKSEKGSRDAKETLEKLEADCGGKARLFVAMSRAVGIPSRVVGGIILDNNVKKITHVWAESYIGGQWIPFDVVNGYFAFIPANYLEIYRGDNSLFRHRGLVSFEWVFIVGTTKIPPVDNAWSLFIFPGQLQNMINILLLIPLGALVIAFFRNIVGITTFGTFAPMLLAFAFFETSMGYGILILVSMILFGWVLRKILDNMKILFIPKISIILSSIVLLVLVLMMLAVQIGERKIYYVTIFPLVIISWMIERFTVAQIEDGTKTAISTMIGTIVVAVALYYVLNIRTLQTYLFSFPELILVVIALLLLIGRYAGLRVVELWRFKELLKKAAKR